LQNRIPPVLLTDEERALLLRYKNNHNLSYQRMGSEVGLSDTTMRCAVVNEEHAVEQQTYDKLVVYIDRQRELDAAFQEVASDPVFTIPATKTPAPPLLKDLAPSGPAGPIHIILDDEKWKDSLEEVQTHLSEALGFTVSISQCVEHLLFAATNPFRGVRRTVASDVGQYSRLHNGRKKKARP